MAGDAGATSSPVPIDPRDLRVSDAEREHVAGLLQKAVGRGLLTLDEFTARTDQALAAQTRGELNVVLIDLPFVRHEKAAEPNRDEPLELRSGAGTVRQQGYWVVPTKIVAETAMGNVVVDFTRATCPHREVTLRASSGTGSVTVIVPRGWHVMMMEATSKMGSVINKATDPPRPEMPILRVYGSTGLGTVKIRHPRGRE